MLNYTIVKCRYFSGKKQPKLASLKNKNCTNAIKKEKCGLAFLPFELAYSKICFTIQSRAAILALSILWKNNTMVKML